MTKRTKKADIVGKYGTRYGASLRKQIKKMEVNQHSKFFCEFCRKYAVKRKDGCIWGCKDCGKVKAGGAYTLNKRDATKSIRYTYKHGFSGFVAVLSQSQANLVTVCLKSVPCFGSSSWDPVVANPLPLQLLLQGISERGVALKLSEGFLFIVLELVLDLETVMMKTGFMWYNKDATLHLFEVAAGLEALVLGEGQILFQVKQVVKSGQGVSSFDRKISGLFKHAISVGKWVRTETNISYGSVSVHYYVQPHIQMNEYCDHVILKYGRPITTCVKVLDMTRLKLSSLNQIKLLTIVSSIDDQNYPEKTHTYFIVVKPLLQERTKRKVQVLPGEKRSWPPPTWYVTGSELESLSFSPKQKQYPLVNGIDAARDSSSRENAK